MIDPVALCAEGEAAWHRLAYASLGGTWLDDGRLARGIGEPPHQFLLGAVTLARGAVVPDDVAGVVCDSFAELSLPGRVAEPQGHWMIAESGDLATVRVPGLTIRAAVTDDDVEWFENLAFLSAEGVPPTRPGELHPRGSQRLPGINLLIAELDDVGVGTALSVATKRVNNVGAVAVMEAYRGRGIGAALSVAAAQVAPGVPAVLSATDLGHSVYRRVGFTDVGRPLHHRPRAEPSE